MLQPLVQSASINKNTALSSREGYFFTADALKMKKGDSVHVLGRLRIHRCTGADVVERQTLELLSQMVEVITD